MSKSVKLLDCTLRDGAYINDSNFGNGAIRGIIKKLQKAHVDIIECGWLKNKDYERGSSFFHVPADLEEYLDKNEDILYCAMIDWDRYDVDNLPVYNGKSIDAIRVVFPYGKYREGIVVGQKIREKGYQVLFQAANTLAYSNDDLIDLANAMNKFAPVSVSIVDTFGAMYFDDLERIINILSEKLDKSIEIGFHAHNNQQLAFALSMHFTELLFGKRSIIVDSTLSGMGRGAGNATTELVASYLIRKHHGKYDMNPIMDAIDVYIQGLREKYNWGYSTPYFIAGLYQCHVNNISYLMENHRTSAKDMRNIISAMSQEERRKYDYDVLENIYLENQGRIVDDDDTLSQIKNEFSNKKILLLAPGKSLDIEFGKIKDFIEKENPICIAVNAINSKYKYDYLYFVNIARYEYAKNAYPKPFKETRKILLSNIKTEGKEDELIICFNHVIKRGWKHFDNAVITCLRMMDLLDIKDVYIAGFDGFKTRYNESYSDENLPTLNPDNKWDELNDEIKDMYQDFQQSKPDYMKITSITESIYETEQ